MKIVQLKVENVKKIKTFEISPSIENGLVVIGGENAQGKSSILDAIFMALGGKRAIPTDPVNHGAEFGEIELILDGDFVIYRRIEKDGSSKLELTTKTGQVYSSPQSLLDGFIAKHCLDPLGFANQDPKTQVKILKELTGLDTTLVDEEIVRHTQDAKNSKIEIKAIEDQMSGKYRLLPEEPLQRTNTSALEQQLQEIMQMERDKSAALNACNVANFELQNAQKRVEELRKELTAWEAQATQLHATAVEKYNAWQVTPVAPDATEINQQLTSAAHINEQAAIQEARQADRALLAERNELLTNSLKKAEQAKLKRMEMIKNAKLPIEGLEFDDEGIKYLGVPLEQASSAERLRVSTAMGLALNPGIKVLLIRDGSLLDKNNLKMLGDMAQAVDGQIWIERVGDGQECSVVLEDGLIK